MPVNLSVRNVDDDVAARLRQRAARHGRSVEAEVQAILAEALSVDQEPDCDLLAAELRALLAGRIFTPSEVLVRESRDER